MMLSLQDYEEALRTSTDPQRKRYYFLLAREYAHIDTHKSMSFADAGLRELKASSGKDLPKEYCLAFTAGLHRIRMYNHQSLGNSTAAKRAGEQSIALFGKLKDLPLRAYIEGEIQYAERRLNLYDQAIQTLLADINMLESLTPQQMRNSLLYEMPPDSTRKENPDFAKQHRLGELHMQLGSVYADVYSTDASVQNLLVAEKYFSQIPLEDIAIQWLMNKNELIKVCSISGHYKKATDLIQECHQTSSELNIPIFNLYADLQQCFLLTRQKEYALAKPLLTKTLTKTVSNGMSDLSLALHFRLAQVYLEEDNLEQAVAELQNVNQILGNQTYIGARADLALMESRCAQKQGRMEEALSLARRSLDFAFRDGSLRRESMANKHLAHMLETVGPAAEAIKHLKLHHVQELALHRHTDKQIIDKLLEQAGAGGIGALQKNGASLQTPAKETFSADDIELRGKMLLQSQDELRKKIQLLGSAGAKDSDARWQLFNNEFLSNKPEFYRRLTNICPSLTPTELRVCAVTSFLSRTDDIADIIGVSSSSILKYRWRIRRKLQLAKNVNLTYYLAGV